MGKYKNISNQTKLNLIDAFWELYNVKRIEKITIHELTKKAGYNRSTFYEYFTDIYDVLDQLENSLLPNLDELPNLFVDKVPVDAFIKLYTTSGNYYAKLLGPNGDPAFAGKIKNGIKNKMLKKINLEGFELLKVDYTLEYILSAMIGILTYWFQNQESLSKKELVNLINRLSTNAEVEKITNIISKE